MKKHVMIWGTFFLVIVLSACGGVGGSDYPVPEELVNNSEPGREDFEDQFGLKIGETGYVVEVLNKTALSITLNEVRILDEFEGNTNSDGRFYMLGNFTVANLGENFISNYGMEYPALAGVSDAEKIAEGTKIGRRELAGNGVRMYRFDTQINQEALHPGEEMTGDMVMIVEEDHDSYLIWFGYQGYSNDITFEISKSEAKRE